MLRILIIEQERVRETDKEERERERREKREKRERRERREGKRVREKLGEMIEKER